MGGMSVHAGAVRQAGIHIGRGLIDAPPQGGHDALNDPHDVLVVLELHFGHDQLAAALNINLLRPVDHNFTDGLVFQ